jgi:hypothetical protein
MSRSETRAFHALQPTIKELVKVEKDLLAKFQNQVREANDVIRTWMDTCKEHEKYSRQDLLTHYMLMENHVVEMLNANKTETKQHSALCREMMSKKRVDIREVWHKERKNYVQMDQIKQMKVDEEAVKKVMDETRVQQSALHDGLAILKEDHGMDQEQAETTADEIRGEAFIKMDKKRLDDQCTDAANQLDGLAKIPLADVTTKDAADMSEGFKKEITRVRNQMEVLAATVKTVSYDRDFEMYRKQLDNRMKLLDQYLELNREMVGKMDKNKQTTAKQAITRSHNNAKGVVQGVDEWKDKNLQGAMMSNRKNRIVLHMQYTQEEKDARAETERIWKKNEKKTSTSTFKEPRIEVKKEIQGFGPSNKIDENHSEDDADSEDYNEVSSGDEDVKIDWAKPFHHKQRKTTAWDIIASGEYKVSNFYDASSPKKDKKTLDSVQMFDGKDITLYKSWKESVSMAIIANLNLSFIEKLFRLKAKLKGVPYGYIEMYQLSGINLPRALKQLDKLYEENSMDQNALFEKLSLCKPVDLFNYDSIQEVLLTIRKIESHCGKNHKDKAGEISIYIKKSPATTASIKLYCDIRQIKKPTLTLFKNWADDQCDALQANRHDSMIKNDKLIVTGVTMKQSTVNNAVYQQIEYVEDGWSLGYEELEA